ncbi:aldehyde dehydrogenase [Alteribacillus sp. HJP-4]|uniref:aldehyde dehydrogenase n=1 Tax=Alteribacillus sp. HJP-4 TaxID=2775394 RepID=UPI0035CD0207
MTTYKHYINNKWITSDHDETIEVLNPATEEVISTIPSGSRKETELAIEAADLAFKNWSRTPVIERAEYLTKIADVFEENKDHLARCLTQENGKVLSLSEAEVDTAVDYFRYMAGWARKYEGEILDSDRPNENILVMKKPIGVIGGIIPWNFPIFIFARKVAPALLTGCTVVIKPAQVTPNTTGEMINLINELDLPKGVLNVVYGKGSTVGNTLASHKKIGMVSMTGSKPAGTAVMEAAAQGITKVNLELGGKAPAIVTRHADLDTAVENIYLSRTINNGQACTNAERVYVHESVAEEFTERLIDKMKKAKIGDSLEDSSAEIGPLVNKDQLDGVVDMVKEAVSAGATVRTGGQTAGNGRGYYYVPTVLTDVSQEMNVIQDEIFGPVIPVMTYSTMDEVIKKANDTEYGLSSSIFSDNYHEIMRAANELKFGETFVNRENFEAIQGFHAGRKQSGIGGADGRHGLEEHLETHVVYMQYKEDMQ